VVGVVSLERIGQEPSHIKQIKPQHAPFTYIDRWSHPSVPVNATRAENKHIRYWQPASGCQWQHNEQDVASSLTSLKTRRSITPQRH
jgi:hypothetical protein